MKKRGQVTIFILLGILIVALVLSFIFLRGKIHILPVSEEDLSDELEVYKGHIENCLFEVGSEKIWTLGKQGGHLKQAQGTYRLFEGEKISYLCWNVEGKPTCRQRLLTQEAMETELALALKEEVLRTCLDLKSLQDFGLTYTYDLSRFNVETDIGQDQVLISANLPMTISKGDLVLSQEKYSVTSGLPLGRLYETALEILNSEASIGYFDTTVYSVAKTSTTNKQYIVQKLTPYPDKLYLVKINDVPYEDREYLFQFFVQDEAL